MGRSHLADPPALPVKYFVVTREIANFAPIATSRASGGERALRRVSAKIAAAD